MVVCVCECCVPMAMQYAQAHTVTLARSPEYLHRGNSGRAANDIDEEVEVAERRNKRMVDGLRIGAECVQAAHACTLRNKHRPKYHSEQPRSERGGIAQGVTVSCRYTHTSTVWPSIAGQEFFISYFLFGRSRSVFYQWAFLSLFDRSFDLHIHLLNNFLLLISSARKRMILSSMRYEPAVTVDDVYASRHWIHFREQRLGHLIYCRSIYSHRYHSDRRRQ